ncbi:MAG TPA: hypothetical protein VKB62_06020 [Streptosporangiaceae bacterium]|nr:hypothetical protein [Streptosporangiaceae bacterium]
MQLALFAGWTTAVLYGTLPGDPTDDAHNADDVQTARAPAALGKPEDDAPAPAPGSPAVVPAVDQLPPHDRRKLELARLRHLLAGLLPDFAGLSALTAGDLEDSRAREEKLASLNLDILTALTAKQPEIQLAYELGRSLRDTANPPDGTAKGLAEQLAHRRIAKLQDWLAALSPEFPQLTAAVVAGSLGRWSDLASVTVVPNAAGQARVAVPGLRRLPAQERRAPIAESMCSYLLQQGDVWLMLLIGELATSGLLTPEGYVTAGEAALRRSGAIVQGIIRHYWFGLLSVAAALGGMLFLAARYLEGGSKVWTSIAAIVGSLGVSAQTIASTASRLTAEATKPVLTMAEEDAMAWAITTLPPLTLTFRGVRHLRRAGVAPTASLSRF